VARAEAATPPRTDIANAIQGLLDESLAGSAELLAWFATGGGGGRGISRRSSAHWIMLADSLFEQSNFLSAVEKYKKALAVGSTRLPLQTVANVRKKIAKCYVASGNKRAAVKSLEVIKGGGFDAEAELLLGKLYLDAGVVRAAQVCFRNVLKKNPMALEAAVLFVESGGAEYEDIISAFIDAAAATSLPEHTAYAFADYLRALGLVSKGEHRGGRDEMIKVVSLLPGCAPACIGLAESEFELYVSLGDYEAQERSAAAFRKARVADPWITRSMDDFCSLLMESGRGHELTSVCSTLVEVDPLSPVSWRSAAILCKLNGHRERAERLDAELQHVCEREAQRLHNPSLKKASQQISLAEIQLLGGSVPEAHITSKDAIRKAPESAAAYCMYAKVMLAMERDQKAHAAYEKAVRLSPEYVDAVIGLALRQEQDISVDKAAETLKTYISMYESKGSVGHRTAVTRARVELASMLISNSRFEEAARHLKDALLVDPTNDLVIKEIETLDLAIREAGEENAEAERHHRRRGRALEFDNYTGNLEEDVHNAVVYT